MQGHGLAYGTKEGRLRLVHHTSSAPVSSVRGHKLLNTQSQLGQELAEADRGAARDSPDLDESVHVL